MVHSGWKIPVALREDNTMLAERFVIATLSLLLVFPPTTMAQLRNLAMDDAAGESSAPAFDEYIAAKARLDKMFALLAQARSQIDRSSFDLDALLDKLDYEAQDIIDFVKNEIRFEQYPGLLRGPTGTLMSRGGNALDQSVVLAKLLNDAGFEARIAGGKLTADQSNLLFNTSLTAPPRNAEPQVSSELIATMRELNSLTGKPNEVLEKGAGLLLGPVFHGTVAALEGRSCCATRIEDIRLPGRGTKILHRQRARGTAAPGSFLSQDRTKYRGEAIRS
jgi:hypothetical protein